MQISHSPFSCHSICLRESRDRRESSRAVGYNPVCRHPHFGASACPAITHRRTVRLPTAGRWRGPLEDRT